MALKDKIQNVVDREVDKSGFTGTFSVEETQNPSGLAARTCLRTKETVLEYNQDYPAKHGEDKLLKFGRDAGRHEINHHGYEGCVGCPQTTDKDYDLFFVPASQVLSQKGFSETDVDYATNTEQDTFLHLDLKRNRRFNLEGIVNFFENVGSGTKDRKFTDFYEAHVKLNMFLWGNKQQKKRMQKFYKHSEETNNALNAFLDRTGLSAGSENPRLDFLDESNWPEITRIYCEEFSKLMTPNYAQSTLNHSGSGTKGRESEDDSEQGNVFQRERKSRNFKKGRVIKANKKGEGVPIGVEKVEAMDMLYESLAEELAIKAETFTDPETMPIARFGKEPLKEGDNLRYVSFGFSDRGEVELRKRRHSVDIPIEVKEGPKSFPKVKVGMNDISASMREDILGGSNIGNTDIIPWGDNSKHHWANLTQYSIWNYLRANHLMAHSSELSNVLFGENTRVIKGIREIKGELLNPTFEYDTQLDWEKARGFFDGWGNLLYTLSDGEWRNWREVFDKAIPMIQERGHSYVHLQFGTRSPMTDYLQENGLNVVFGQDGRGIVQRTIDLTDKLFRGGSQR